MAVVGLVNVAGVTAGGYHTCSRQTDGTARCWGLNSNGQLGDGTQNDSSLPVKVPGFGDSAP